MASELPISHSMETQVLLDLHDLLHITLFQLRQLTTLHGLLLKDKLAGIKQLIGALEGAKMLRTEWWIAMWLSHFVNIGIVKILL